MAERHHTDTQTAATEAVEPESELEPESESEKDPEALVARRRFLSRISVALGAMAGAVVSVPIIAYLLSPIISPAQNVWRDVADLDQLQVGETVEVTFDEPSPLPWAGQTAQSAAWLRRNGEREFIAFGLSCTHLGCPVNWRPEAQLFLCPCHGGVYYATGEVAGGPPPRPLVRYQTRIFGSKVQILTQPLTFSQA